jgi:hypothetical protein
MFFDVACVCTVHNTYFVFLLLCVPISDYQYVFVAPESGEFLLAFARRNVPIDKVFVAAAERGLEWRIVDDSPEGISGVEPIYSFTFKAKK